MAKETIIQGKLTVQELKNIEAKFLAYKNKVLEILRKKPELVKYLPPEHTFFEQIKTNIMASWKDNQRMYNNELMDVLTQWDGMARQLLIQKTCLVNALANLDAITQLHVIATAIESVQSWGDSIFLKSKTNGLDVKQKNALVKYFEKEEKNDNPTFQDVKRLYERIGPKHLRTAVDGLGDMGVSILESWMKKIKAENTP